MIEALIEQARKSRANAYAPYSVYHVGAAVLGANGRVYSGCNIENLSYGLTVCAERNAVAAMIADGCREIQAVAVVTRDGGTPCGACRQVLLEFAPKPEEVQVICVGDESRVDYNLAELFPAGFSSQSVKKAEIG